MDLLTRFYLLEPLFFIYYFMSLASMENMPEITLEWVSFKDLSKEERLSVLNFICWIAYHSWILTYWERKKAFERTQKLINK